MKTLAEKIRERRRELGITQIELSQLVGISSRSIFAYEAGEKSPRPSTVISLAKALDVPAEYLQKDEIDSLDDIKKNFYISKAGERYGEEGARDMETLLNENIALFAGGELSQSEKDMFFEAVMRAYISCKDDADKRKAGEA